MQVFISVDMEGISGLVRWPDVSPEGIDFERNRVLMTEDANAAIRGAFEEEVLCSRKPSCVAPDTGETIARLGDKIFQIAFPAATVV